MSDQTSGILSPFLQNRRIFAALPYLSGSILDFGCGNGKLSQFCRAEFYTGVDIDCETIEEDRKRYPACKFLTKNEFDSFRSEFDTIVSLAVIEHIDKPEFFLKEMKSRLRENGRIVLTTPHPSMEKIHFLGSKIGLFSRKANEEHKALLNRRYITDIAETAGLKIVIFKRFLCGANQLIVLSVKTQE